MFCSSSIQLIIHSDEVARISTAAQLGVRGKFLWGRICYQIKLALEIQRRLKQNIFSSSFSLKNHLFLIPPIKFFFILPPSFRKALLFALVLKNHCNVPDIDEISNNKFDDSEDILTKEWLTYNLYKRLVRKC